MDLEFSSKKIFTFVLVSLFGTGALVRDYDKTFPNLDNPNPVIRNITLPSHDDVPSMSVNLDWRHRSALDKDGSWESTTGIVSYHLIHWLSSGIYREPTGELIDEAENNGFNPGLKEKIDAFNAKKIAEDKAEKDSELKAKREVNTSFINDSGVSIKLHGYCIDDAESDGTFRGQQEICPEHQTFSTTYIKPKDIDYVKSTE